VRVRVRGRREGGCARRRRNRRQRLGWEARLLLGGRYGSFDGFAAAGVELEELRDLIFRLRAGGDAEAGNRGTGGGFEIGVSGNELEQVESDVFGTASGEIGALFHGAMVAVEGQVEQLCKVGLPDGESVALGLGGVEHN